mgnify:FL=1
MIKRIAHQICFALLFCVIGAPSLHAQALDGLLGAAIKRRASGALALLGLAAIPSETASTLFLDTDQEGDRGTDFRAGQFGGRFTWGEEFPLYLEGYVG